LNAEIAKFDPMLTMRPPPCGIITRAAAWHAKNTLLVVAAIVAS
jgi:hypothetical protein